MNHFANLGWYNTQRDKNAKLWLDVKYNRVPISELRKVIRKQISDAPDWVTDKTKERLQHSTDILS